MVAVNIRLPNIRKMFIPDPGFTIVDMDLSGADAQVVAWEAEDDDLKEAFRKGLKVHIKNSRDLFPEETKDLSDEELKATRLYKEVKTAVHGFNYGASPKTIASRLKWKVAKATEFREKWFYLHPGIPRWHRRLERHLQGRECWWCRTRQDELGSRCRECGRHLGRTIRNAFGYRRIYFDRIDGILPQALAWIPQSTVALVTTRALLIIEKEFPFVQLLLQVHDSIVFQIPFAYEGELPRIKERLDQIEVPYPDPLRIPWGIGKSRKSWGDL